MDGYNYAPAKNQIGDATQSTAGLMSSTDKTKLDGLNAPTIMVGADGTNSGTAGYVPAPTATDNTKYLKGDGTWAAIPTSGVMTGATSSAAGTSGLVPAPAAGQHIYYLKGDGTWDVPPGAKLIVKDLDTVTNTSGSYTHSTILNDVTSDMKAIMIELSDPSAFLSAITVTTADGSITLSCNSVAGTSTVKVTMMFIAGSSSITSSEFDVLAARIGTLGNLHTTDKSNVVAAVNETFDQISNIMSSTFYRQFWNSTNSISLNLDSNSSSYIIWTAGNSAGTLGAIMDSTYGSIITVSNGEYGIIHKGSGITISFASNILTITSSANVKMAIVEL